MYKWRNLSEDERKLVLAERRARRLPWHRPPHRDYIGFVSFIITAACYEHAHIIGKNTDRMGAVEKALADCCDEAGAKLFAWCILANHYHLLVRTENIALVAKK